MRIGYLEGEAYGPFAQQTDAAAQTLAELGYLSEYTYTGMTDSRAVWSKICESQTGDRAEFVEDAHYVLNTILLSMVALCGGEYAGFAVMLPATAEQIMKHMKMSEEEVLAVTEGEPALIYKSAAVRVCFERRGIMKTMATVGLAQARDMSYHSIFGSAWVYDNTIPIEGTFRSFGFTRLYDRKMLWYDDEDYHCVVCNGRCVCDGIIYCKKL